MADKTPAKFAIGTFSIAGCHPFAGLVLFPEERVIAVDALRPLCTALHLDLPEVGSTLSLLEHWNVASPVLQSAANALTGEMLSPIAKGIYDQFIPMNSLRVHPPVASRQIFMSGANYFKHVVDLVVAAGPGGNPGTEGMSEMELRAFAESLMNQRKSQGSPYVFTKPVSVLSGAFDPIILPRYAQEPDWELELAVIIGAHARYVSRANALEYVAGYTIANDITNRDWVWARGDMKVMGSDWLTAKGCPTYLPVGPYMVPSFHIFDPSDLRICLELNGKTMQNETTSDMIFDVARLVEHVSNVVQLLPGDLICTGSPAGNGAHYGRFLQSGDIMAGEISGLGKQRTPVFSE